jgi:hypothetical protein
MSQDVSYIRLESSQSNVAAGDRFSIDVFAFAHEPVNAVDVTFDFNGDAVEILGVDTGDSVLTIFTEDPIISDTTITIRGGTFRRGFVGEHKLATLQLRAKSTGQTTFRTSETVLLAGDGAGTPVAVSQSNTSNVNVFIYDENTGPSDIRAGIIIEIITDIDGDGEVSLRDISAFMGAWASRERMFDFNGDGRMTFRDFSIILADYFFN